MAKSLRCKREKRLRAIRRDIVKPFYDAKDAAKLAAQEAALNAPKLHVPSSSALLDQDSEMDVEMADGGSGGSQNLKPVGGVGKKLKSKMKNKRRRRKGKIGKRNKI
ncbi:hypothetical protein H6P81_019595 [Aristolochia fimbriata]|uniref:Uncharacterized protein n=1 Tax=Aristolochia fimbriata TaxID=158543 RepID=A0AAV7DS34_ARIFI|nr:hypothetical protein H6P81_019595 [Aristolochia fimbriata]